MHIFITDILTTFELYETSLIYFINLELLCLFSVLSIIIIICVVVGLAAIAVVFTVKRHSGQIKFQLVLRVSFLFNHIYVQTSFCAKYRQNTITFYIDIIISIQCVFSLKEQFYKVKIKMLNQQVHVYCFIHVSFWEKKNNKFLLETIEY